MKKNKMMRLASFLLVAVLITTSAISGTYAKYTTASNGSDSARVAKWGVELQVFGNLFGDTYINEIVSEDDADLTVQSSTKTVGILDDVVAPGTKNENGFSFSLNGKPEVDGEITTTITAQNIFLADGDWGVMIPVTVVTEDNFDELVGMDDETDLYVGKDGTYTAATAYDKDAKYYTLEDAVTVSKDYYPVVFKMTGEDTEYEDGDVDTDTLNVIAKKIGDELGLTAGAADATATTTYSATETYKFDANTQLDAADQIALGNQNITWEWAFENASCTYADGADTILGMIGNTVEGTVVKGSNGTYSDSLIVGTDYCLNVAFGIDILVEQVD